MISSFEMAGQSFRLRLSETAFQPTSTTRKLAEHLVVPPGADVLDLGCGAGPLSIIAARMGAGHVYALDVMPEACELTKENAAREGLADTITVRCGDLFEPVAGQKFDVIIDDVSGMAEGVARVSPWFPDSIPTGGEDGADVPVRMLQTAKDFLKPGGVIYFPVLSLSRTARILDAARESFGEAVQCVETCRIPFCEELLESLDTLNKLRERGLIEFGQRGSRLFWTLQIYRGENIPA